MTHKIFPFWSKCSSFQCPSDIFLHGNRPKIVRGLSHVVSWVVWRSNCSPNLEMGDANVSDHSKLPPKFRTPVAFDRSSNHEVRLFLRIFWVRDSGSSISPKIVEFHSVDSFIRRNSVEYGWHIVQTSFHPSWKSLSVNIQLPWKCPLIHVTQSFFFDENAMSVTMESHQGCLEFAIRFESIKHDW
jgi:hypothetical protein